MIQKTILTLTFLLACSPTFADSFNLSPAILNTDDTGTLYISSPDLQDAKGMDIEVLFDPSMIA